MLIPQLLLLLLLRLPAAPCDEAFDVAGASYLWVLEHGPETVRLERLAREAAAARQCYGGSPRDRVANLYAWEAYALLELARFHAAETALDGFFAGFERDQPPALVGYMHVQRGSVYLETGRPLAALEAYRRAALILPVEDVAGRAEVALNTALAYGMLGDRDAALGELGYADSLLARAGDADPYLTLMRARVMGQEAEIALISATEGIMLDQAAPERALSRAGEAAAIYERLGSEVEAVSALLLVRQGRALLGRHDEAVQPVGQAEALARQLGKPELVVRAAYILGRVTAQAGQLEMAREYLQHSRAEALRLRMDDFARQTAGDLGLLEERAGRTAEAERWFREAVRLTEAQRSGLGTGAWSAGAFAAWEQPYRGLARVLLAGGRTEEAFLALEAARARRTRDLQRQADRWAGLPPDARIHADSLARLMASVRTHLSTGALPMIERHRLQGEEIRLARAHDALFGSPVAAPALSLPAIQEKLAARGGGAPLLHGRYPEWAIRAGIRSVFVRRDGPCGSCSPAAGGGSRAGAACGCGTRTGSRRRSRCPRGGSSPAAAALRGAYRAGRLRRSGRGTVGRRAGRAAARIGLWCARFE